MNLEGLNNEQLKAVKHNNGPLLILAGAGSGKTKVLTMRVANLINEYNVKPSEILAITFTNKAANEMKERIHNVLGSVADNVRICTFHSFGLFILRREYEYIGYERNFTIIDSEDSLTLIKKILKELDKDANVYNPRAIRSKISGAKNELIDAKKYSLFANTEFEKVVEEVYIKYEEKLRLGNSFDFDDLLIAPIKIFRENKEVLEKYQNTFKYILIDEYQDTNEAQYILTKMIASKYRNICVVGDPDQSIYSFRGSNYRNILNFEKDYKEASIIVLEKNYRSTSNILNAANDIIKNNKNRKEKNLWTENGTGKKITYHRAENEKDEAYYVVKEIKKLDCPLSDIAVLYRTNAQSRNIEEALLRENIPFKVVGSFYFYNRKEIKDLIAYLKVIYNEKDDINLLRIINVPKRKIGLKTIENLTDIASLKGISIYDAIEGGKELEFKKLIEELKVEKDNLSLTELVELVLEKSGMKASLLEEKTMESEIRLENLEEFKSITRGFEEKYGVVSLEEFLSEISLVSDVEEYKNNDSVVTLLTVHSAKGLEFKNVFIIGLEEGIFPHKNSFDSTQDMEEERRLCYVAVTRAKNNLWLINAKKRILYGTESSNPESRFIKEIDENYLNIDETVKTSPSKIFNSSNMIDDTITYTLGEKVKHAIYGIGVIVGIDDKILTIAFPYPHEIKKIMKGHKSITKLN
ncbi:MAG: UvrD-helicase domain-containing protein [Bacillales bacterium]|nr:UvrD-helicase domain-containing protein [Bacillales bacterium]